ncbi:hypothetical protein WJX73_006632 [Symbiochloris irregularis]|uniref:Protein NO VEIN C-terminal domain-containing protein n=1 Tax=Symbiochloris irregularis TaxID=706552 RepID=A0AAW1PRL5_9CHLO
MLQSAAVPAHTTEEMLSAAQHAPPRVSRALKSSVRLCQIARLLTVHYLKHNYGLFPEVNMADFFTGKTPLMLRLYRSLQQDAPGMVTMFTALVNAGASCMAPALENRLPVDLLLKPNSGQGALRKLMELLPVELQNELLPHLQLLHACDSQQPPSEAVERIVSMQNASAYLDARDRFHAPCVRLRSSWILYVLVVEPALHPEVAAFLAKRHMEDASTAQDPLVRRPEAIWAAIYITFCRAASGSVNGAEVAKAIWQHYRSWDKCSPSAMEAGLPKTLINAPQLREYCNKHFREAPAAVGVVQAAWKHVQANTEHPQYHSVSAAAPAMLMTASAHGSASMVKAIKAFNDAAGHQHSAYSVILAAIHGRMDSIGEWQEDLLLGLLLKTWEQPSSQPFTGRKGCPGCDSWMMVMQALQQVTAEAPEYTCISVALAGAAIGDHSDVVQGLLHLLDESTADQRIAHGQRLMLRRRAAWLTVNLLNTWQSRSNSLQALRALHQPSIRLLTRVWPDPVAISPGYTLGSDMLYELVQSIHSSGISIEHPVMGAFTRELLQHKDRLEEWLAWQDQEQLNAVALAASLVSQDVKVFVSQTDPADGLCCLGKLLQFYSPQALPAIKLLMPSHPKLTEFCWQLHNGQLPHALADQSLVAALFHQTVLQCSDVSMLVGQTPSLLDAMAACCRSSDACLSIQLVAGWWWSQAATGTAAQLQLRQQQLSCFSSATLTALQHCNPEALEVCLGILEQQNFCNATLEDIQRAARAIAVPRFMHDLPVSGHALFEEVAKLGQSENPGSHVTNPEDDGRGELAVVLQVLHTHQKQLWHQVKKDIEQQLRTRGAAITDADAMPLVLSMLEDQMLVIRTEEARQWMEQEAASIAKAVTAAQKTRPASAHMPGRPLLPGAAQAGSAEVQLLKALSPALQLGAPSNSAADALAWIATSCNASRRTRYLTAFMSPEAQRLWQAARSKQQPAALARCGLPSALQSAAQEAAVEVVSVQAGQWQSQQRQVVLISRQKPSAPLWKLPAAAAAEAMVAAQAQLYSGLASSQPAAPDEISGLPVLEELSRALLLLLLLPQPLRFEHKLLLQATWLQADLPNLPACMEAAEQLVAALLAAATPFSQLSGILQRLPAAVSDALLQSLRLLRLEAVLLSRHANVAEVQQPAAIARELILWFLDKIEPRFLHSYNEPPSFRPGMSDTDELRTSERLHNELHLFDQIISGIYAEGAHFVLELCQNADDLEYSTGAPQLCFWVDHHGMSAFYNEDGFAEKDVVELCQVGASEKGNSKKATGMLGQGFKSIFSKSAQPHVISQAFRFKFEYEKGKPGSAVRPVWVEDLPPECPLRDERRPETLHQAGLPAEGGTAMWLPWTEQADGRTSSISELLGEIKTKISPALLLFFSKLTSIQLVMGDAAALRYVRQVTRLPDWPASSSGKLVQMSQRRDDAKRNIKEAYVSVGVPWANDASDAAALQHVLVRGQLYITLPATTLPDLKFHINGTFQPVNSREFIVNNAYNRELLARAGSLYATFVLAVITSHGSAAAQWLATFPVMPPSPDFIMQAVCPAATKSLMQEACVPYRSADGALASWAKPQGVFIVSAASDESADLIARLVLHLMPSCKLVPCDVGNAYGAALAQLEVQRFTAATLLDEVQSMSSLSKDEAALVWRLAMLLEADEYQVKQLADKDISPVAGMDQLQSGTARPCYIPAAACTPDAMQNASSTAIDSVAAGNLVPGQLFAFEGRVAFLDVACLRAAAAFGDAEAADEQLHRLLTWLSESGLFMYADSCQAIVAIVVDAIAPVMAQVWDAAAGRQSEASHPSTTSGQKKCPPAEEVLQPLGVAEGELVDMLHFMAFWLSTEHPRLGRADRQQILDLLLGSQDASPMLVVILEDESLWHIQPCRRLPGCQATLPGTGLHGDWEDVMLNIEVQTAHPDFARPEMLRMTATELAGQLGLDVRRVHPRYRTNGEAAAYLEEFWTCNHLIETLFGLVMVAAPSREAVKAVGAKGNLLARRCCQDHDHPAVHFACPDLQRLVATASRDATSLDPRLVACAIKFLELHWQAKEQQVGAGNLASTMFSCQEHALQLQLGPSPLITQLQQSCWVPTWNGLTCPGDAVARLSPPSEMGKSLQSVLGCLASCTIMPLQGDGSSSLASALGLQHALSAASAFLLNQLRIGSICRALEQEPLIPIWMDFEKGETPRVVWQTSLRCCWEDPSNLICHGQTRYLRHSLQQAVEVPSAHELGLGFATAYFCDDANEQGSADAEHIELPDLLLQLLLLQEQAVHLNSQGQQAEAMNAVVPRMHALLAYMGTLLKEAKGAIEPLSDCGWQNLHEEDPRGLTFSIVPVLALQRQSNEVEFRGISPLMMLQGFKEFDPVAKSLARECRKVYLTGSHGSAKRTALLELQPRLERAMHLLQQPDVVQQVVKQEYVVLHVDLPKIAVLGCEPRGGDALLSAETYDLQLALQMLLQRWMSQAQQVAARRSDNDPELSLRPSPRLDTLLTHVHDTSTALQEHTADTKLPMLALQLNWLSKMAFAKLHELHIVLQSPLMDKGGNPGWWLCLSPPLLAAAKQGLLSPEHGKLGLATLLRQHKGAVIDASNQRPGLREWVLPLMAHLTEAYCLTLQLRSTGLTARLRDDLVEVVKAAEGAALAKPDMQAPQELGALADEDVMTKGLMALVKARLQPGTWLQEACQRWLRSMGNDAYIGELRQQFRATEVGRANADSADADGFGTPAQWGTDRETREVKAALQKALTDDSSADGAAHGAASAQAPMEALQGGSLAKSQPRDPSEAVPIQFGHLDAQLLTQRLPGQAASPTHSVASSPDGASEDAASPRLPAESVPLGDHLAKAQPHDLRDRAKAVPAQSRSPPAQLFAQGLAQGQHVSPGLDRRLLLHNAHKGPRRIAPRTLEVVGRDMQTGRAGECLAYLDIRDSIQELGLEGVTVTWVNEVTELHQPYDILIEGMGAERGSQHYLEIKSTLDEGKQYVELSFSEAKMAEDVRLARKAGDHSKQYVLVFVTNSQT